MFVPMGSLEAQSIEQSIYDKFNQAVDKIANDLGIDEDEVRIFIYSFLCDKKLPYIR